MENLFNTDKIRMFSGKYVDVFNPDPETILIEDIAHHLSMIPRWCGATRTHYSVAQHSIEVYHRTVLKFQQYHAKLTTLALSALMHDASEAYLCDIPRPIKKRLPDYKRVEENLMKVIAQKFEFNYPTTEVKHIDNEILQDEWDLRVIGNGHIPTEYTPAESEHTFLLIYAQLKKFGL